MHRRLESGLNNTYSYNGLGQRSGKVDSTGTFNFTRNSDAIDAPVVSDGAARYVQGSTGLLSEVRGGTSKYYHADALGSTRAITNSSGVVTDTKATDAFGITYSAGTSGSTPTPFGFAGSAGYQSDSDTGLMLLGHRYYDASVGRFLSRDPIQAGTNWFAYCGNDPVNGSDPTGHTAIPWEEVGIVGGGAVAVGGAIATAPIWVIIGIGVVVIAGINYFNDQVSQANTKPQPPSNPMKGPLGGSITLDQNPATGKQQVRVYDENGDPKTDYDINHPPGDGDNPHAHDWVDGVRQHPGRSLYPGEVIP